MKSESLPPEIWQLIVSLLHREDQKTWRTLSKFHHDFATRTLFAHVNVYFGLWIQDHVPIRQSQDVISDVQLKNNITWDVLRHISLFPDFAKVVKTISVKAYLNSGFGIGGDIFHTRALITALQALRNLRAFHWRGRMPELGQDVLTALAQSSGHSLEELHIPITNATAPYLSAFGALRELRAVDVNWHRPPSVEDVGPVFPPDTVFFVPGFFSPDFPLDGDSTRALQMTVDGMAHTLTRVTTAGDFVWGCSIRSMLGLQELEVVLPHTAGGLALVLRHCFLLRALTLYPLAPDDLLSTFNADPDALPELRAFKFIYCGIKGTSQFEYRHAQSLAAFIENKKRLTSLDVDIDLCVPRDEGRYDEPILEAVARLPRLEVLGFSLVRSAWEPGNIRFFRQRIPRTLTALRLSVSVDHLDNDILLHEWFHLLKDLTSLQYLHILDRHRTFDLKQQLLEDPPPSLELVGYGPYIRSLVRDHGDPDDDRPKYSPVWPLSKVYFRSAADFGCAAWEWLLRWHGAFNINDMAPGVFDWSGGGLPTFPV